MNPYLRVSNHNLYCWRMAGLVPYFKIGRAVRFRRSEVDAAIERMRLAPLRLAPQDQGAGMIS